jgi:phosphatidylethanolamine-binding protein (PEBP) family uncharacterized protein
MRNTLLCILTGMLLVATMVTTSFAEDFSIAFEWGDIPLCTSGSPNRVPNPEFVLSGVPEGTKTISFRLTDLDVPSYDHGGGTVEYSGQDVIESGAFKYQSPCPPSGSHTYEWKAYAKNKKGFFAKKLGTAKAKKEYPK